jgi:hypothetical protein
LTWRRGAGFTSTAGALLRTAVLALAAVLFLATPARAQVVSCPSIGFPGAPLQTCTISSFHQEFDTQDTSPGGIATGNAALQGQLNRVLAGPNGTALLTALNGLGVLGPQGPPTKTSLGTTTTITTILTIGPGTVVDGPDNSLSFFIPAGSTNLDQNTSTDFFFLISPGSQPLSRRGANWLTGDLHTEFQTAILDGDFSFVDGLLDHGRGGETEAMLFASGRPQFAQLGVTDTPPPSAGPWTAWFKGDYAAADFTGTADNFGFDYHGGGGQGGIDYRAADFLLGGAFAYDHENVTQNATTDHGAIDTWRVGGYASWQPGDWSFTGVLAGGFHSIDASRLNLLVMPSASSYGARSFNAAVEAARRFALWGATVQPMLGLVYTNLNVDRFSETGGLFNITGRAADIAALRGYAGARAYQSFALVNGMVLTPEVRARVLYDFLNDARALTASFVDDPTQTSFLVSGLQPARLAGLFGAGATLRLNPMWRAFVGYDAEVRGGNVAHLVTGGLKANW